MLNKQTRLSYLFLLKWLLLAVISGATGSLTVKSFTTLLGLVVPALSATALPPPVWALAAAALLALTVYRVDRGVSADAIPSYLQGIELHTSSLTLAPSLLRYASTLVTVGTFGNGGIAGPLGRVCAGVSAAIGGLLSRLGFTAEDRRTATICGMAAAMGSLFNSPIGCGVGVPLWLTSDPDGILPYLTRELEKELRTRVRIENNVRSYSMYKKWLGKASGLKDFMMLTIRHGVGVGIFLDNRLVRGHHGLAGELSHVGIGRGESRCRCGKTGCLETLVNNDTLYRQYLAQVRHIELASDEFDDAEIRRGLEDLFERARAKEGPALEIVRRTAGYLAEGIGILLLILDIPHVIISAEFGDGGEILIPHIEEQLSGCLLPGMKYTLAYYPLEKLGFAHGSAMLILNDYYALPDS